MIGSASSQFDKDELETFEQIIEVEWDGKKPSENGFGRIDLPCLERKDSSPDRYIIHKNEGEQEIVDASTVIDALEVGAVEDMVRVEHANCRIGRLIHADKLKKM